MYDIQIKIKDFDKPTLFLLYYELSDRNDYFHFMASNLVELKDNINNALEVSIPGDAVNFWLYSTVPFYIEEVSKEIRTVSIFS